MISLSKFYEQTDKKEFARVIGVVNILPVRRVLTAMIEEGKIKGYLVPKTERTTVYIDVDSWKAYADNFINK